MEKAVPVQRHGKTDGCQLKENLFRNLDAFFPEYPDVQIKENGGKQHPVKNENLCIGLNQLSQNGSKSP